MTNFLAATAENENVFRINRSPSTELRKMRNMLVTPLLCYLSTSAMVTSTWSVIPRKRYEFTILGSYVNLANINISNHCTQFRHVSLINQKWWMVTLSSNLYKYLQQCYRKINNKIHTKTQTHTLQYNEAALEEHQNINKKCNEFSLTMRNLCAP